MYAMIRRYRMAAGSMEDLMHKVDTQYADRLQEQLGIIHYRAIAALRELDTILESTP